MTFRKLGVGLYSTRYTTDLSFLALPNNWSPGSNRRVILCCHGRTGNAFNYGVYPMLGHVDALVAAGYAVFAVDHARINSWGDPDSVRAMDDAYTYVTTTLGMTHTVVGLMGWSMGGTTAINWMKRNVAKVAGIYAFHPVTDLRFFREGTGTYTPTYSGGGVTQGDATLSSEIGTAYAVSTTAVGAYTIPASTDPTGITITHAALAVGNYFTDANNSGNVGKPLATVNAASFTYDSRTATTLVGCRSTTGSTIAVANGAAITGTYDQQSLSSRPWQEAAYIGGLGVPIKVVQATDDTIIPPASNTDATNGFVARAANANVTLRTVTGGHTVGVVNVPSSEVVSFFQTNLPVVAP